MLDEIQRLVPGYDISRLGLLSGRDEHTQLVQITGATGLGHPELVMPSNDTLFTSGTLGRYSATLSTVMERYASPPDPSLQQTTTLRPEIVVVFGFVSELAVRTVSQWALAPSFSFP